MPAEPHGPASTVELIIGDTTTILRVMQSGVEHRRIELAIGQTEVLPGPFRTVPRRRPSPACS